MLSKALVVALLGLPGCGESAADRGATQENEEEQALLQGRIQKGLEKPPLSKPAKAPKRR